MLRRNATIWPWLTLAALIACAAAVYHPGLSGNFLFDDYANLPSIGAHGPIDNTAQLERYLTSGTAGPTGRPVALASFLIDATHWPAPPRPFKRTNLILELINGVLLAGLLWLLGREMELSRPRRDWAAVLGAGFWLIHPLFVSTTLYVVERETMLAATFGMLGLMAYIVGRRTMIAGRIGRGGLGAAFGLGAGTLLATLSKANGALVPLLALVLEFTLLTRVPPNKRRALGVMRWIVLGCPIALFVGYMVYRMPANWNAMPGARPWTYAQRLLTEPRMLSDYLKLLWIPRPYTTGLFNDQIAASSGLLTPWTTLPAIGLITALLTCGLAIRRRIPSVSAAILFYFAGMLIVSTYIPLELYFEHRNYLPALLMFFPLAIGLTAPGSYRRYRIAGAVFILAMLLGMTWTRADLWGNTTQQAKIWATINPQSARAVANLSEIEIKNGQPQQAIARLKRALPQMPDQPQITFNLVNAECTLGEVKQTTLHKARHSLAHDRHGIALFHHWFSQALNLAQEGRCSGFNFHTVSQLIEAASNNPVLQHNQSAHQNLAYMRGKLALAQNQRGRAIAAFDRALRLNPAPAIALKQASDLGVAGDYCAGLEELRLYHTLPKPGVQPILKMTQLHKMVLRWQGYWPHQFTHIRHSLLKDAHRHHQWPCTLIPIHIHHPSNQSTLDTATKSST